MADDLLKELMELERQLDTAAEEISRLREVVRHALCKKCGNLSWDIPLTDYCQCEGSLLSRRRDP